MTLGSTGSTGGHGAAGGGADSAAAGQAIAKPFPPIGSRIRQAYRELFLAGHGTPEQRQAVGPSGLLARPWDPPSCEDPNLRAEVWAWLDDVVAWVNSEYVWDVRTMIPTCWPQHPHLVHEVAVLADQRNRAGTALTSDALEEWQRFTLPSFLDRMRNRIKDHCEDGHQTWPARSRYTRFTSDPETHQRRVSYARDLQARAGRARRPTLGRPQLAIVDLDTGEITDPGDQ
jgi:hypothetical protein